MAPYVIDLLAAALVLTVFYSRYTIVLGVVIATVMVIPATLVTPHLHSSYATVNHVVVAATALRLFAMARRGLLPRDRFRATPLHLALGLLFVTWVLAGIVFAPSSAVASTGEVKITNLGFAIAAFVVTLALLREIDDPWLVARLLTGSLALTAVIATIEHLSHHAYGHWLFSTASQPGTTNAAQVLETRAGHYRVRSSAEFALAYAWVAVMLLPIATYVALRLRRVVRIGLPILALTLLAIYWTYARSAAAAIPAGFVLLALGVRDRRTMFVGGAAALAAVILFAVDPTIHHHLSLTTAQGSVGVRVQRLPPILEAVTHHPYLGLGLGGLQSISVTTTDNFFLSAYGETGVVGAVVMVAFCVTAVAQAARGVMMADRMRRSVIAASLIGFVAFLVSGVFDDALLLTQPVELAMLLVALATATAEPVLGFGLLPKWAPMRVVFLTVSGGALGALAYLLAPVVVSQQSTFTTISPLGIAQAGGAGVGPSLINTVCDLAHSTATSLPGTHIDCRDDHGAPGVGTLRVESPSSAETLRAYAAMKSDADRVSYLSDFATIPTSPPIADRATGWKTAPVSGAVGGFALALIAPLPFRRRRHGDVEHPARRPQPPAGRTDRGLSPTADPTPPDVVTPPAPVAVPSPPSPVRRPVIPALDP
jgi:hypothetical protein